MIRIRDTKRINMIKRINTSLDKYLFERDS